MSRRTLEWFGTKATYTQDVWLNDPNVFRIDSTYERNVAVVQGPAMVWFSDAKGQFTFADVYNVKFGERDVFEQPRSGEARVAFYTADPVTQCPVGTFSFVPLPFILNETNTKSLSDDTSSHEGLARMRFDRISTMQNKGELSFIPDDLDLDDAIELGGDSDMEDQIAFGAEANETNRFIVGGLKGDVEYASATLVFEMKDGRITSISNILIQLRGNKFRIPIAARGLHSFWIRDYIVKRDDLKTYAIDIVFGGIVKQTVLARMKVDHFVTSPRQSKSDVEAIDRFIVSNASSFRAGVKRKKQKRIIEKPIVPNEDITPFTVDGQNIKASDITHVSVSKLKYKGVLFYNSFYDGASEMSHFRNAYEQGYIGYDAPDDSFYILTKNTREDGFLAMRFRVVKRRDSDSLVMSPLFMDHVHLSSSMEQLYSSLKEMNPRLIDLKRNITL